MLMNKLEFGSQKWRFPCARSPRITIQMLRGAQISIAQRARPSPGNTWPGSQLILRNRISTCQKRSACCGSRQSNSVATAAREANHQPGGKPGEHGFQPCRKDLKKIRLFSRLGLTYKTGGTLAKIIRHRFLPRTHFNSA